MTEKNYCKLKTKQKKISIKIIYPTALIEMFSMDNQTRTRLFGSVTAKYPPTSLIRFEGTHPFFGEAHRIRLIFSAPICTRSKKSFHGENTRIKTIRGDHKTDGHPMDAKHGPEVLRRKSYRELQE